MSEDYPGWICTDCGEKYGRARGTTATVHVGSPCGWCGRDDVPVSDPRGWSYPKWRQKK